MKKIVFLLLIISSFAYAQDNIIYKSFDSYVLNAKRTLKIYLPDSYETEKEKTYAVAVVFDAELLFDVYVANAKLFASRNKAPEQIVVGIFQNQNEERYTDCDYSSDTGLPNGESTKFYKFVREELLNYIDDNYRTSVFRTLVGNTLTANFASYFFLEKSPAFKAFININPSYATGMTERMEAKSQSLSSTIFYYLSSGNFNLEKKLKAIDEVNDLLKLSENEKFRYKYNDFSNSTKTASMGQAIPSAIGYIFELFAPISKKEFDENIADLSPSDAILYLEKKYVEIDYLFGSDVKVRENDIYIMEPIIIDKENGDYLEEFGKMILRIYPESPMGDYYIGYYYEIGYDYRKALKYYKNGYAKIGSDNPNSDGYYANVERVLAKQKAEKAGISVDGEEEEIIEDTNEDVDEDENNEETEDNN